MMDRLRTTGVALWCLVTLTTCRPEPPQPPPPGEEFPPPAQPSLRPADDAEVIASWDSSGCKTDWTVGTTIGTAWACGSTVRRPAGDRTGQGDVWGWGTAEWSAGLTETT